MSDGRLTRYQKNKSGTICWHSSNYLYQEPNIDSANPASLLPVSNAYNFHLVMFAQVKWSCLALHVISHLVTIIQAVAFIDDHMWKHENMPGQREILLCLEVDESGNKRSIWPKFCLNKLFITPVSKCIYIHIYEHKVHLLLSSPISKYVASSSVPVYSTWRLLQPWVR